MYDSSNFILCYLGFIMGIFEALPTIIGTLADAFAVLGIGGLTIALKKNA